MECYLCKHCENLTNFPLDSLCEESPDGEHDWVSGEEVEKFVSKLWEGPILPPAETAEINGAASLH